MQTPMSPRYLRAYAIAIATSVLLSAGYIELFPMNFYNLEYPMWKYTKDYINQYHNEEIEILILGDSRTMAAIIPKYLSRNSRSLCLGGATSIEMYYLLKNYLANHKPPKYIFFALSPVLYETVVVFWERSVKWKFLSPSEALEVIQKGIELQDHILGTPLSNYGKLILLRANFIYFYLPDLRSGDIFLRKRVNHLKYNEMTNEKGFSSFGTASHSRGLNAEAGREHFKSSPLLSFYLHKFLDLAKSHHIRLTSQPIPVNVSSYVSMRREYILGYRDYMKNIQNDYPDFIIEGDIYHMADENFGDASHLNERGALLFTQSVRCRYFDTSCNRWRMSGTAR